MTIITYSEPGKARKQCLNCKLYVHARSLVCNCGYQFIKKNSTSSTSVAVTIKMDNVTKTISIPKEVVKEPKVSDTPGRGKRLCLKCSKYYGAKLKSCPTCGFKYIKELVSGLEKEKKQVEDLGIKEPVTESRNYVGRLVYAPAGACCIEPTHNIEDVESWCSEVFNHGLRNNRTLTKNALWSYMSFYNNSQEFKNAVYNWCEHEGYERHCSSLQIKT